LDEINYVIEKKIDGIIVFVKNKINTMEEKRSDIN
jgi:hypothetical protein